jgi:hypothetical protein
MTPLYHARKSDGRWFMRAFALLIIGVPAVAQQAIVNKRKSKGDGVQWVRRFLAGYLCSCLVVSASQAAELKEETIKSWDEYIQASRGQMQDRLRPNGRFLWVDEEPQRNRQVRAGKILVSPGSQKVPQPVTSGLIHDWIGAAFIPGATLDDVLAVVRDYDRYKVFYKPNVIDSKSLSTDDAPDAYSMLLVNRQVVGTVALNGEYEACFLQLTDKQWYSVSYTTRIQEIRDYAKPGERKLPPGEGNGYIWRGYSMGRYEERDGGVYVEQETIALSRDIPAALRWVAEPIIRQVSKKELVISLQQTEEAVRSRAGSAHPLARREATGATCSAAGLADARIAEVGSHP